MFYFLSLRILDFLIEINFSFILIYVYSTILHLKDSFNKIILIPINILR